MIFHLADIKLQSGGFGYSKLFRDVLIYPGCYKASTRTETRKIDPKEEDPVLGPKAILRHASVSEDAYCHFEQFRRDKRGWHIMPGGVAIDKGKKSGSAMGVC